MQRDPPKEPNREDRRKLSSELEKLFNFSPGQANYLAVNSYGYCFDMINQTKQIQRTFNLIKKVLKGLEIE